VRQAGRAAQAASESAENVKETVRESGRDRAEQLRDSAEEHGQVPSQDRSASRPNPITGPKARRPPGCFAWKRHSARGSGWAISQENAEVVPRAYEASTPGPARHAWTAEPGTWR
jgi:hypothetical protein